MIGGDMAKELLKVENLKVLAEEKEILHGVNLSVGEGEVHVIMGPNGAGKSTLGSSMMGDPRYTVEEGRIFFQGEDITEESTDKIAGRGMFLSFQNPEEIPGITVENMLRTAK